MSKHEFTGKTTEEAISEGLRKLGCTISDVKVVVLEEGAKGLFGLFGSKQARVLLTMNDDKDDALTALASLTLESFDDHESSEKRNGDRQARSKPRQPLKSPVSQEKRRQEETQQKGTSQESRPIPAPQPERPSVENYQQKPNKSVPDKITGAKEELGSARGPVSRSVTPNQNKLPVDHNFDAVQSRARQFLQELTNLMQVQVQVDLQTDPEGNLLVQMVGDVQGILIGRRGETLDALQYLTSLLVNRESEEYVRVTLDTENYRAKREDSLRRLATRMATRAYKTGRKVAMEPMNPYERRILHSSLQDHPHVTTHSEGDEPNRHVVITLKGSAVPPRKS